MEVALADAEALVETEVSSSLLAQDVPEAEAEVVPESHEETGPEPAATAAETVLKARPIQASSLIQFLRPTPILPP